MIESFVSAFMAAKPRLEATFAAQHPESYKDIVRAVVETLNPDDDYGLPDSERIHVIDDGEYQGTLLFIIAANSYQPSDYWFVKVSYGSCSACDTLQSIRDDFPWDGDSDDDSFGATPTPSQVAGYMTLALHIVQGLKKLGDGSA
jgi:hypothetical protein